MELDKKPDISIYLMFLFYMDLYFFLTSDVNLPGKSGLKVLSQHPKKSVKFKIHKMVFNVNTTRFPSKISFRSNGIDYF